MTFLFESKSYSSNRCIQPGCLKKNHWSITELNVESSISHIAENDICTWLDDVFLYDVWYQRQNN